MNARRCCLSLLALFLVTTAASAHYHMLLLQPPAVKKGEAVKFTYQWGHPFEHQLFDATLPESLFVIGPAGQKTDLLKTLAKIAVKRDDGKSTTSYEGRFQPPERGDHVFILTTEPIWMEEEKEFYQDTVKVVLHVQAQKGWDANAGKGFELSPLTRPYGLLPGAVFQAQALVDGKPLGGALVEIERYNATPPKELPADEFITRTAKTDPNGVVTTTLPEAGWWCITAQRDGGVKERQGKKYPVRQRATLWVHVDGKAISKQ